jgi:hypothetical protein
MKIRTVVAASLLCLSTLALADDAPAKGKVVAVDGDKVTIEVESGKGAQLPVGTSVEVNLKEKKKEPPKKGAAALQGC